VIAPQSKKATSDNVTSDEKSAKEYSKKSSKSLKIPVQTNNTKFQVSGFQSLVFQPGTGDIMGANLCNQICNYLSL